VPQWKTPGVYTEEVSTLPPSVAEVSTAVPAFIGSVERGRDAARISSLLDYRTLFGTAKPVRAAVKVDAAGAITAIDLSADAASETLFYAVSHYFANGGGPCWIVPVGGGGVPTTADFQTGLARLEREDEPTLILFPQAADRLPIADYGALAQAALAQCNRLKDRFVILDVPRGSAGPARAADDFRGAIGSNDLSYAAAYHPYLSTTLAWVTDDAATSVERAGTAANGFRRDLLDANGLTVGYTATDIAAPGVRIVGGSAGGTPSFKLDGSNLVIGNASGKTAAAIATAWAGAAAADKPAGFTLVQRGDGSAPSAAADVVPLDRQGTARALGTLQTAETALYNRVREAVARARVTLPPSPAVAGAYASTDRDRGVWKAPANVGLAATIGPVTGMTDGDQEGLNVDATAGKSINAIRAFAGRGTLIWGARTLAGNDNEWRYVPVRRLFITIEESTRKASAFAVFEPNDATTWLKVKGMIESYLYGLWEQGALAGSKPDQAYYVHVGLGSTMTAQDVLEGRMLVEIGIAAVRPAEFVVLRFSHRLQQA